ncbi:MAG: PEP-CTERM sorting domain-containing protein [Bacillota bacterium]
MRGVNLILVSVLLGTCRLANASVLATSPQIPFKFDCGPTGFPDVPHPADCSFQICYLDADPASGLLVPLTDTTLFDPTPYSPHDRLPAFYTVTAGKRFEAFAAKFTDGTFEWLSGQPVFYALNGTATEGPSTTFSESWLLSPRTTDFAGYKLTAVTVTTYLDDITPRPTYTTDPHDPYVVTGHAIVTFEGTPIPEPTSLMLLAGSLALLARTRRCR